MRTVDFQGWTCVLQIDDFARGGKALQLVDQTEGYPIARASLWVEGLAPDEIAVKDYGENAGMLVSLLEAAVVTTPHRYVTSGYVKIPICRLLP